MRSRLLAAVTLLALATGLTACASPGSGTGSATGDGPLVAFYGDSYTLGTGASDPANRWSTVVSEERGWREFNPSVNGLGFVNHRDRFGDGSGDLPSLIIAEQPDIVFVTMGLNDAFSFDDAADRIHEQITTDLDRLRDALPEARFIVVEPFWYTDERPQSIETIIGWVADAAQEIDADTIPGASHWIEGHPEWMAADGLHPNDEGYAEMARRMDAELERLGL
ncbi:SGNH/GDSL hydrolase family protein [Plantibacter sp. MMLR14_011]|uniref:SGNH/GDSL hydrolase family protein n=1 Tax=Plantibacter sp. MMLR14_011 TaxID=1898746 RepID=UPI0008DD671F|nr:SGNH/GDSL hydrolase family protein [Plantibacter sp. MMLR14_011]OII43119.1 G-D-S-L family lipolytic protein [Plantibacter sp. MMLR14_011]